MMSRVLTAPGRSLWEPWRGGGLQGVTPERCLGQQGWGNGEGIHGCLGWPMGPDDTQRGEGGRCHSQVWPAAGWVMVLLWTLRGRREAWSIRGRPGGSGAGEKEGCCEGDPGARQLGGGALPRQQEPGVESSVAGSRPDSLPGSLPGSPPAPGRLRRLSRWRRETGSPLVCVGGFHGRTSRKGPRASGSLQAAGPWPPRSSDTGPAPPSRAPMSALKRANVHQAGDV